MTIIPIPDEAVEAAHEAMLAYKSTRGIDNQANAIRAALEAALPHVLVEQRAQAGDITWPEVGK